MSEATTDSLRQASSSSLSTRFYSAVRRIPTRVQEVSTRSTMVISLCEWRTGWSGWGSSGW